MVRTRWVGRGCSSSEAKSISTCITHQNNISRLGGKGEWECACGGDEEFGSEVLCSIRKRTLSLRDVLEVQCVGELCQSVAKSFPILRDEDVVVA